MFGQRLEADIVREMVAYDEELKVNYTIYQRLLRALTNKDYIALKRYLHTSNSSLLSRYMRTSIRTLKKYLPYIKNSFHYPYRSEEHTSELQSRGHRVCRLLLDKIKQKPLAL